MQLSNPFVLGLLGASISAAAEPLGARTAGADTVLEWLKFGNERHAAGKPVNWHQSMERRKEVSQRPAPGAVIVSCSDSRVPPEIVFDQGFGDLHVVRVDGNVAGEKELGSIEYAVENLHTPLIVVMGHRHCGVVEAAVRGTPVRGHIASLLASLSAAVSRSRGLPGDPVDNAARANVNHQVREIQQSEPVLGPLVGMGRVKVVAAYYDPATGVVEWQPGAAASTRLLRSGM